MSATGSGAKSAGTAVCVPFLRPSMVFSSNGGVLGKKRTWSGRRCTFEHNVSCSISQTHQVSISIQETFRGRHDTKTHGWGIFPFLFWTHWNRIPQVWLPLRVSMARTRHLPSSNYPTLTSVTMTLHATETTHPPSLELKDPFIRLIKSEYYHIHHYESAFCSWQLDRGKQKYRKRQVEDL